MICKAVTSILPPAHLRRQAIVPHVRGNTPEISAITEHHEPFTTVPEVSLQTHFCSELETRYRVAIPPRSVVTTGEKLVVTKRHGRETHTRATQHDPKAASRRGLQIRRLVARHGGPLPRDVLQGRQGNLTP